MRRSIPLILCVWLLLGGCSGRESTSEGYDAAVRLGGEWFNCDRLYDTACSVKLMHIPPTYQGAARQKEVQTMRRGINLLRDRFGAASNPQPPTTDFRMAELFWASGDAEYWSQHSQSAKATFPVKFTKLSDGYVQIEVCKIYTRWEIRAVHYGLPASNPSSAPMIAMINSELSKVSAGTD